MVGLKTENSEVLVENNHAAIATPAVDPGHYSNVIILCFHVVHPSSVHPTIMLQHDWNLKASSRLELTVTHSLLINKNWKIE